MQMPCQMIHMAPCVTACNHDDHDSLDYDGVQKFHLSNKITLTSIFASCHDQAIESIAVSWGVTSWSIKVVCSSSTKLDVVI